MLRVRPKHEAAACLVEGQKKFYFSDDAISDLIQRLKALRARRCYPAISKPISFFARLSGVDVKRSATFWLFIH